MKFFMKFVFLIAIVIVVWSYNSVKTVSQMNPLIFQNIEALAEDESLISVRCIGRGSVDCPIENDKVDYIISSYGL